MLDALPQVHGDDERTQPAEGDPRHDAGDEHGAAHHARSGRVLRRHRAADVHHPQAAAVARAPAEQHGDEPVGPVRADEHGQRARQRLVVAHEVQRDEQEPEGREQRQPTFVRKLPEAGGDVPQHGGHVERYKASDRNEIFTEKSRSHWINFRMQAGVDRERHKEGNEYVVELNPGLREDRSVRYAPLVRTRILIGGCEGRIHSHRPLLQGIVITIKPIKRQCEIRVETYEKNEHSSDEVIYGGCTYVAEHVRGPLQYRDQRPAYVRAQDHSTGILGRELRGQTVN